MKGLIFKTLLSIALLSLIGLKTAQAETFSENNLVFICFGQSNMEGNAQPRDIDKTGVDGNRFKKMYCANSDGSNKGKWASAYPPLCRKNTGMTPVDYFGRYLCDSLASQYKVYVIVVAIAGCSMLIFNKDKTECANYISQQEAWMKNIVNNEYDGYPYGRIIEMAKKAQEIGVIKGVLLHQGETDAYNTDWMTRTNAVYRNMIEDLGLKVKNVPMLVGEVVNADQNGACAGANSTLNSFCNANSYAHIISSSGCPAGVDNLHFTAEGYEMMGKRYGAVMLELLKKKGYLTKADVAPVTQEQQPQDSPIYNINGQQITAPTKGLNIINGHKYYF